MASNEESKAAQPAEPAAGPRRRVAFCGLGIMGGPMAANLARAGFELSVYTRTREKAERLAAEHGARAAGTPSKAAEGADAFVSIVPDAPQGFDHPLSNDVFVDDRGLIFLLDRQRGFHILERL